MKILDRLGLMLRADAHGVMDPLEERSLLIKQHLRDAELALAAERSRLAAQDEELRRLQEAAERSEARLAALDADVTLALSREEEELARHAVRKLLPERAMRRRLTERVNEVESERARLAERLREQESALDALRVRARARLADLENAESGEPGCIGGVSEQDVELELLRRRDVGAAREATT